MDLGASQLLFRDIFTGDRTGDFRASDEHIACLFAHHDEVGQGRGIDGAAGAGPEDGRYLRYDARGQDIAFEYLGVARQAPHPFLDARPAAVVYADNRRTHLQCLVHHLADLLRKGFRQGSAKNGEILRKNIHHPAVDRAMAGYYPVGKYLLVFQPKIVGAMGYKHIEFLEAAFIQ